MLEYFTYKKYKKRQAQKQEEDQRIKDEAVTAAAAAANSSTKPSADPPTIVESTLTPSGPASSTETPLLTEEDERFLERLTSGNHPNERKDDEGPKPPLPPRIKTPEIAWDSDGESHKDKSNKRWKGKGKAKEGVDGDADGKGKTSAGGGIGRRISLLVRLPGRKKQQQADPDVKPDDKLPVPVNEAQREKDDLTRVLDDLSLSAQNNRVFSLSKESTELVGKFTVVLKDLVNGVPTAANDLKTLLEDPDGTLAKNFEKLPSSFKKLVTQMPSKVTSSLAPELLAAAAEAQGIKHAEGSSMKETAMKFLTPTNLQELITKPSAVVGMLKAIMNALKLRWPAFIGTSLLWSIALFLLLIVLWYCHKRGREVRLEKENQPIKAEDRIEELPDDPQLPAPHPVPVSAEATGSASASGSAPPPRVSGTATQAKR